MKSFLCGAALAAVSLQVVRGTVSVARIDLANQPANLCAGVVLDRAYLEKECGTTGNECPVFVKVNTKDGSLPGVPCDLTVELQGLTAGSGIVTDTIVQGVVVGWDDSLVGDSADFAIAYPVLKALCPLPCVDSDTYTCAVSPNDCEIQTPYVETSGVIASFLSGEGPFELRYLFATPEAPVDPDDYEIPVASAEPADGTPYAAPKVVGPMIIEEGDTIGCGSLMGTLYTEDEAYLPNACGGTGQVPCPIGGKIADFGGQCHDAAVANSCIDVEFWMDGLADTNGTYCGSGCPRIGSIHRRFKLTEDTTGEQAPFVDVPLGAWRDMCPFECATQTSGGESSYVCAAEASTCVAAIEDDESPVPAPDWTYSIPGSATATLRYVTHTMVDCDSTTSTTTSTTSTTRDGITIPPQTTTVEEEATSGTSRAVIGGMTALAVACGVLYV